MEVEEIERQVCKIPRLRNGARPDSGNLVRGEDEGGGLALNKRAAPGSVGDAGAATALRGWHHHHHTSRIIRVSRATGGKDRHSKVLTSRGLRDRRVRLSVTTAIQFYDLQDRLGYDQPSKAVEWLIKAAADAIAELPSLNTANIPETPRQLNDEKRISDGTEQEVGVEQQNDFTQQNSQSQHFSLSKSACSSASDTSKNSGLSLSRSDVRAGRAMARERARERTAKEKEKDQDQDHQQRINHISHQNSSFTELLTCGIGNSTSHNGTDSVSAAAPMDYFGGALLSAGASSRNPHSSSGFPCQIQLGTSSLAQTMSIPPLFPISADSGRSNNNSHPELQHYVFASDHLFPVAATTGSQTQQQNDYSLNFSISPGFVGFNRGTLQSNSPTLLPHHLQRLSSPLDAPPFFISTAADHHNQQNHQFPTGFDGRGLQLCYGDTNRGADHKPKPRN